MTGGLRWSAVVIAGLCWVFLTRLAADSLGHWAVHLPLIAPPIVVAALRLPYRPGMIGLLLIALLYDAGTGAPFGLSASVALPLHCVLTRLRSHLPVESPLTGPALALAVTPAIMLAYVAGLFVAGHPVPSDTGGLLTETALASLLAAAATPWLTGLTLSLLRLFGVQLDVREFAR